jgi:hypothetical protein
MIHCPVCNLWFENLPENNKPTSCPFCKSRSSKTDVRDMNELKMSGSLVLENNAASGLQAIRVVDDDGRSSAADLQPNGFWRQSIEGRPPDTEEGTLPACQRLVARLRMDPGSWSDPAPSDEQGIDCITDNGRKQVFLQVVRPVDAKIYQTLDRDGRFEDEKHICALADDLRQAVEHKNKKHFPRGRQDTILAIDLRDFAAHALREVVENFRHRYGTEVASLGFMSIWAVGPLEQYVFRLDE